MGLHEKYYQGLIKESNYWWHKQRQKFCWAEDLFKPQVKDETPEEFMSDKIQRKYGNKITFQSRLVTLEQWDTTPDLLEWSNTKIWKTIYWQKEGQ